MNIVEEAFKRLYPNKEFKYKVRVRYSRRFKGYNANVCYTAKSLDFHLSMMWKDVSREIRIGLIQSLLLKVFNDRKTTLNIDMYNIFLKNVHIATPKTRIDPILKESFERLNRKYFNEMLEMPNLVWGQKSKTMLGRYDYGSDTITISSILKRAKPEVLDYIMYHEMLHKKHKFSTKNNRSFHHTKSFKEDEKRFENREEAEIELENFIFKEEILGPIRDKISEFVSKEKPRFSKFLNF